jgi:putative spermidine/putrescine transport system ATP-binding protein
MADGQKIDDETRRSPSQAVGNTVDIDAVTHRYGSMVAVDNVTLTTRAGEIMALLGPSGCGKTTLLRIIAGFVRQTSGQILINGRSIDGLPPNLRNIGIVFQNYALFPHMSVSENIAYGLKARGTPRGDIGKRVASLLDAVRLTGLADRLPRQLSGGQQQRVALARVLAVDPSLVLLDEPFSALDKSLRLDMQIEIKRLQREFGLTAILVTHDQDEAMGVADRVAVMNKGRIEQCDTPVDVYDGPASLFVSGFIGTTNQLPGRITQTGPDRAKVELDHGGVVIGRAHNTVDVGTRVVVAIRPEQLALHTEAGEGLIAARHRLAMPMGSQTIHELEREGGNTIKVVEPRIGAPRQPGRTVWLGVRADAIPSIFRAPS